MSSNDESALTRAVVEEGGHRRLGAMPDATQLDMLRGPDGAISFEAVAEVRREGRPKGARNKRTQQLAAYITQKFGDPMDALCNFATMPLKDALQVILEAQGGQFARKPVTALDVLKEQLAVLRDIVTYVHGRQPVTVNANGKVDAVLLLPGVNASPDVDGGLLKKALAHHGINELDLMNAEAVQDAAYDDCDDEPGGEDGSDA